jgi:putative multiple sugar transport system substrate-binding protein
MRKSTVAFLALAAAVMTAGCSKKSGSEGAFIGIAIPETHVTRWIKDGNALKAEAEKRGYRAVVQVADANQDIQNRQIASFINVGAKLLIVGNIDEGVVPAIAEAAAANVEVISYDRLIQNSADYNYYITFNNFKVGVLQGESLVEALGLDSVSPGAPKLITLFAGAPADGNAYFFYDGAMSVLNPYIDKGVLKVIGPYPRTSEDMDNFKKIAVENWQAPLAKARMEELLVSDAKGVTLDAILAPNDFVARAIISACKADPKYKDKVPAITGQDGEFESAVAIKNGNQYCTVFKNTAKLAEAAVILADQILKGETPDIPGAVLATGPLAKMGDTGKKTVKTYLLDPILVTSGTLNIPIDAGFYTDTETEELRR